MLGAIPVDHSTNLLRELMAQLPAVFNPKLAAINSGGFAETTNHNALFWTNVQPIVPLLRAGSEKSGDFLFGEFVPPLPISRTKEAPAELFSQFTGRNDLVYYDWELTQMRLMQWQPMVQMLPILRPTPRGATPGAPVATTNQVRGFVSAMRARNAWLKVVEKDLETANAITEVAVTGPNEARLIRKSALGFTGLELVLLSDWLTDARELSAGRFTMPTTAVLPKPPAPAMLPPQ
jgi:hypothetical protein